METLTPDRLKKNLEEIDNLIKEAITNDFLSDKLYEDIITKIGLFDEAFLRALPSPKDAEFLKWAKMRLDKICNMLINEQIHAKAHDFEDDVMHIVGDYYNEDNSFYLSPEIKLSLKKIVNEKFSNNKR